jgi:HK97 family phage major capsid protein
MAIKAAPPTTLPIQLRAGVMQRQALDPEARTVQLSFASDIPVAREFGLERLSLKPGAMNAERLEAGAPLLMDHNWPDQVGKVERCWIENKKAYATVRFGRSARAEEIFQDVKDGIRTSTSFAYIIDEMERSPTKRSGKDEWIVTKYTPIEISLVSIPADHHVGVDRAATDCSGQSIFAVRALVDRSPMNTADNESEGTADNLPAVVEGSIEVVRARNDEVKRARLIREIAKRFSCQDFGERAIEEGLEVPAFEHRVLTEILHAKPIDFSKNQRGLGLSDHEKRSYSLLKAIGESISPRGLTGLEKECSEALERELGTTGAHSHRRTLSSGHSFFMPMDLPLRAGPRIDSRMDVTVTAAAGSHFVSEEFLGDAFITYLRNALQVRQAGATVLDGLTGMVIVPKQAGPTQAMWLSETAPVIPSDVTTTAVAMQPKRLSALVDISRQLVIQSSIAVENLVREDIANSIAEEIDATALFGGTELPRDPNRPMGVFGAVALPPVPEDPLDNVQTITYTGNPVDLYAFYVEMIALLDSANIANNSRAFITNPSVWSAAMTTQRFPNGAIPIVDNTPTGNRVLGYPYLTTNIVPNAGAYANRIVFGNWKDLMIGFWNNGLEIITDPYTLAATAQIRLVTSVFTDLGMRYRRSFVVSNNAPVVLMPGAGNGGPAGRPVEPAREGLAQESPKRDKR